MEELYRIPAFLHVRMNPYKIVRNARSYRAYSSYFDRIFSCVAPANLEELCLSISDSSMRQMLRNYGENTLSSAVHSIRSGYSVLTPEESPLLAFNAIRDSGK